jgi:hypothetical protein
VLSELAARYGTIATEGDQLTFVYDAGQDSAANQVAIEATPLHFVGSLRPSDHLDLLAQPTSRYKVVDSQRCQGLSAFEAKTTALGKERRRSSPIQRNCTKRCAGASPRPWPKPTVRCVNERNPHRDPSIACGLKR